MHMVSLKSTTKEITDKMKKIKEISTLNWKLFTSCKKKQSRKNKEKKYRDIGKKK